MKANSKRIIASMQAILFLLFLLGISGHILPAPAQSPGAFTATGNMIKARAGHTATLLHDGKVLIAGGSDGEAYSAELYNPATGAFTATGDLLNPRSFHTATLLPDGKVLIAGGMNYYSSVDSAELYDPTTGTFTATGYMTTYSSFHTATLLNSGHVLIAGGSNHNVSATSGGEIEVTLRANGELYNPATGKFAATGSMPVPLFQPTATLLADGTVLVASPNWLLNGAASEVYSPLSGEFSRNNKGDGMSSNHSATMLASGKVLLAGGVCYACAVATAGAFLYDPANGTLTPTGSMIADRSRHAVSLLPDGTVLITGGTSTYSDLGAVASAEVYAPLAGTFSPTGNMTTTRTGHTYWQPRIEHGVFSTTRGVSDDGELVWDGPEPDLDAKEKLTAELASRLRGEDFPVLHLIRHSPCRWQV